MAKHPGDLPPVRAFDPERIRVLVNRIVASGQFSKDTPLGRILHPRDRIAFRRRSGRDSLHIGIGETELDAHIDRLSPLSQRQGRRRATYSVPRMLAHLALAGFHALAGHSGHSSSKRAVVEAPPRSRVPPPVAAAELPMTPMGPIEEGICLLDTPLEPWTVEAEVALSGHLDLERLRIAVDEAMARHPIARARHRSDRGRRAVWELPQAADVEPVTEVADQPLDDLRADFYSLGIPLTESPPLRIRLVHQAEADRLMLSAHHAAIDGIGAFAFLSSVAAAYRGETAGVPDELGFRDWGAMLGARGFTGRVSRAKTMILEAAQLARGSAHLAAGGGHPAAGYGVHHRALTGAQTERLLAAGGSCGVDAVLAAALISAMHGWNAAHGDRDGRLILDLPFSVRPGGRNLVGNYLCLVAVSTTPEQRAEPKRLIDAVAGRLAQIRERNSAGALIGLFEVVQHLPRFIKPAVALRVIADPFVPGALLANLGTVDLGFGEGAGEAVEAWTSPPAMMPEGLSIGVVSLGGVLRMSLRYRHPLWGAAEAANFADGYVAAIDAFTEAALS